MQENVQEVENTETVENLEQVENLVEEQKEQQESPVEEAQASGTEKNLVALRQAKEAAERERDAYYRKLQDIEQAKQPQKQQAKQPDLGDDDLVEGRHVKALRQDLERYTTEARLKAQYPDFDQVVSQKSVEQLRTAYPELAATLAQSNDMYNAASSAYTLIKKLGIYDGQNYDTQKDTVAKNSVKPRPMTSVSPQQGESPLSHANAFANGLTPELKQKLYREMMEARSK